MPSKSSPSSAPAPAAPAPLYDPAAYDPADSVAYAMRRTLSGMAAQVDCELAAQGLTHAQWLPLLKISLGASNAAELSRECSLDAGSTTRMLDRLEAKGLISRSRSADDRRVARLALTPAGARAAATIPPALCKAQNDFLRGFSRAELDLLMDFLARMARNGAELRAGAAEGAR